MTMCLRKYCLSVLTSLISVVADMRSVEHETIDVAHWRSIFPYESLIEKNCPRQFTTTPPGSPLDLWLPSGTIVSTPKGLMQIIQVRESVSKNVPLVETSKSDVFIWASGEPKKPFLTKIGGIPFRPKGMPWPSALGKKYSFLFQVYFGDSNDLIDRKLPADVMVVFGNGEEFFAGNDSDLRIEWFHSTKNFPVMSASELPKPEFYIPTLHGVYCRIPEFSGDTEKFESNGRNEAYLLSVCQATKIGKEPFWIQGDSSENGESVFFVFSGPSIRKQEWPLVDVKEFSFSDEFKGYSGYQNELSFSMGDVGCLYFIISPTGRVRWVFQCY